MSDYASIYEPAEEGWGAYSPDLPGVVAHGDTLDEVQTLMGEAIALYVGELGRLGRTAPPARSVVGTVTA